MVKKYTCNNCSKPLSSYHSLWRHKKTCQGKPRSMDINDIINNIQRKENNSTENSMHSIKPFSLEPRNTVKSIPAAIKPKSLTELAMEMEEPEQSDSETEEKVFPLPKSYCF